MSGLRRSSGEGNGNPLHYSCLENPMDRGACMGPQPGTVWGPKTLIEDAILAWHRSPSKGWCFTCKGRVQTRRKDLTSNRSPSDSIWSSPLHPSTPWPGPTSEHSSQSEILFVYCWSPSLKYSIQQSSGDSEMGVWRHLQKVQWEVERLSDGGRIAHLTCWISTETGPYCQKSFWRPLGCIATIGPRTGSSLLEKKKNYLFGCTRS